MWVKNHAAKGKLHMSFLLWEVPTEYPDLNKGEVHVWSASLHRSENAIEATYALLAADERARAERFHFARDRQSYISSRGLLRRILGVYLNKRPEELRFSYSPHGKPSLTEGFASSGIEFNVSHSNQIVLFAVSVGRELGVDVEYIKPEMVKEEIAERFFSSGEVATLRALPEPTQITAFFSCWTRKEAYIKAKGEGLSIPLDQFEVSMAPHQPAKLERVFTDLDEADRWTMEDLLPASGYAGAVCAEGNDWELKCWEMPDDALV